MKAGQYNPPRFNFNRFCHRLAALIHPEIKFLPSWEITIPQDVLLVDTSVWEGLMDSSVYQSSNAQGIIPKVSQGVTEDVQFKNTWANFNGKTRRGGFHFYDPRFSPTSQVNAFVSLMKNDPGELPMVVDWEASWAGNYGTWSSLYGFLEGLKAAIPDRKIAIYTGYYYWLDHSPNPITQASSLNYFAQYDLWLAWYADASLVCIPKPWTALKFWQFSESGNGAQYGADTNSIDLDWYNGTQADYETEYPFGGEPDAYIIKRPLSEVEVCFTPGSGELLLMSAVEQAAKYGWDACMNGGAGFDYTDVTHAIPKSAGFENVNGIPYARRMLTGGQVNPNLDTTYRAPWSILGYGANDVYLIVTRGMESVSGMTQTEAAYWLPDDITNAYLMDSGRSSQIEENGTMLYWPYEANNERVPQCIGLKAKGVAVAGQYDCTVVLTTAQRLTPSIQGTEVGTRLPPGYVFTAIDLKVVKPGLEEWLQLPSGNWTAAVYPNSLGLPKVFVTYKAVIAPPPPGMVKTHDVEIFSDGSMKVDGVLIAPI